MLSHFSDVQFLATLWTVACQAPLSIGFSGQEYWSGLPCRLPWDLPDTEIELVVSYVSCFGGSLPLMPSERESGSVVSDYTVHGILQARTREWATAPFSRGSSQPRYQTQVSPIAGNSLPAEPQGKSKNTWVDSPFLLQWVFSTQ